MTIGTTSNFTVTRNELIAGALSAIGVSEPQETDMALGIKLLNLLIRNLDAKGQWLHAISNTPTSLTTIASQASYATGSTATTINENILNLVSASILIGNSYQPLEILDKMSAVRAETQFTNASQPVAIYLERANLRENNKIWLFPTPNAAFTIHYNFQRPLFDFTTSNENPDFPSAWFLPLRKMLAYELSFDYNKSLNERQILQQASQEAFLEVKMFNADKPSYATLKTEYF